MGNPSIAVLMTCHNRRKTTLSCLAALHKQSLPFHVYLVDDGSQDGTTQAVKEHYPNTHIIPGDGNLFWVGGMRLAFAAALAKEYEFYLWLNDDTILTLEALEKLTHTYNTVKTKVANHQHSSAIIVGSVQDPISGELTYGGRKKGGKWYYKKLLPVIPTHEPQPCSTMQGNIVLIPHDVATAVGNIDAAFVHTFGDLDYGLRARKLGYSIWVAPSYLGTCEQNSVINSWADTRLPWHQRLIKVQQIKNFPIKAWTTYL
ncbi:MAG: glycosyltransferase family 2 protein, partial [Cyanobacteria bacterium J06650_10]